VWPLPKSLPEGAGDSDNPSDCSFGFEDWAPFSNGVTREGA